MRFSGQIALADIGARNRVDRAGIIRLDGVERSLQRRTFAAFDFQQPDIGATHAAAQHRSQALGDALLYIRVSVESAFGHRVALLQANRATFAVVVHAIARRRRRHLVNTIERAVFFHIFRRQRGFEFVADFLALIGVTERTAFAECVRRRQTVVDETARSGRRVTRPRSVSDLVAVRRRQAPAVRRRFVLSHRLIGVAVFQFLPHRFDADARVAQRQTFGRFRVVELVKRRGHLGAERFKIGQRAVLAQFVKLGLILALVLHARKTFESELRVVQVARHGFVDLRRNRRGRGRVYCLNTLERTHVAFDRFRAGDCQPISLRRLVRYFTGRESQRLRLHAAGLDGRLLLLNFL